MELRHIHYFLAVAREQNITRAAAQVGIKQPPLSLQIRDLEREIGTRLFHRIPKGIELTEAGRAFQELVQSFPQQIERAVRAAQRAGRGEIGPLRVGYTASAAFNRVVPDAIKSYLRVFPDVDLSLLEANTRSLVSSLLSAELDAAFLRPGSPGSEKLQMRILAQEKMIAVLPAGHPLAASDKISIAQLRNETFILTPPSVGPILMEKILAACERWNFSPILGQPAPQIGSIINLVAAGLGISLVPASMRQMQVTGVVYRDLRGKPPTFPLALAYRRGETSTVVRNFITRTMG